MQLNNDYAIFLETVQNAELQLNLWVQNNLKFAETMWTLISTYITVAILMDVALPIIGALNYQLMVVLAAVLSVTNALTSIIKWTLSSTRPYWFIREAGMQNINITLHAHNLVCETSAGFPSSHISAWTTFAYIVAVYFCNNISHKYIWFSRYYNCVLGLIVGSCAVFMCLSRLYFGTQFLHQCVISTLGTIFLLHFFDTNFIYQMKRVKSVIIVFTFGLIPISVYFYKLQLDIDPFWTIRTGFKFCPDPLFLKHEDSPVFILARDFGFLLGVAISTPIYMRYISRTNKRSRLIILLILEVLNIMARWQTPKQSGRFMFVASEFMRNLLHSYGLLMILSKVE